MRLAGLACVFAFWAGTGNTVVQADLRESDSPFGVLEFLNWDHDWNGRHYSDQKVQRAVTLMKEAGIEWLRMDFLLDDIEPKKGEFHFEKYDRLVEVLEKNGIKILGMLDYNTSWGE